MSEQWKPKEQNECLQGIVSKVDKVKWAVNLISRSGPMSYQNGANTVYLFLKVEEKCIIVVLRSASHQLPSTLLRLVHHYFLKCQRGLRYIDKINYNVHRLLLTFEYHSTRKDFDICIVLSLYCIVSCISFLFCFMATHIRNQETYNLNLT